MSDCLESLLDAARRAECEANDAAMHIGRRIVPIHTGRVQIGIAYQPRPAQSEDRAARIAAAPLLWLSLEAGVMAKKLKLADVLWKAANEHLSVDGWCYHGTSMWSCNAVAKAAIGDPDAGGAQLPESIRRFLRSMGCRTGVENYSFGTKCQLKRQGVRYMWLLLAMHVAEDEGIEIEVNA